MAGNWNSSAVVVISFDYRDGDNLINSTLTADGRVLREIAIYYPIDMIYYLIAYQLLSS